MKIRIIALACLIILGSAMAVSCEKESEANIDVQDLAKVIGEKIDLTDFESRAEYFQNDCGISPDEVVKMVALKKIDVSNVGNAEALLLIETADKDKAKDIEEKLKTYKTNKLNELSNYNVNPDYERQWHILDESEVIVEQKYVFWAVEEKSGEINGIIKDYIKSHK